MDKCGLTPRMEWLNSELQDRFARLREDITDKERKKLYKEITALRDKPKEIVKDEKTNIITFRIIGNQRLREQAL